MNNVMRIAIVFLLFIVVFAVWISPVVATDTCQFCHTREHQSWKKTRHSNKFSRCEVCHDNCSEHAQDSSDKSKTPAKVAKLSKTEQNNICGKCHYNQELFGRKTINPHDKHGLFMSVGFEGQKRQLSCLDCHSGHKGKSNMLVSARAHVCYRCHKTAIITMGIFQPFNYVTMGKTCQACHIVHGGSAVAKCARMGVGVAGFSCVVCHLSGQNSDDDSDNGEDD